MKDALFLMQEIERVGSGDDARREIAEDRSELEMIEYRNGDCGCAKISRRLNQKFAALIRH